MNGIRSRIGYFLAAMMWLNLSAPPRGMAAGWSTLGDMPAPAWDGRTLQLQSGQGTLAITPLADDIVRVRFTTAQQFGRDHSYAVVAGDLGTVAAKAEIYSILEACADEGMSIIVASSELPELLRLCDRIAVMRAGRVVEVFERGATEEEIMSVAVS